MWPNSQFSAELVTFTEEILMENFIFLCSMKWFSPRSSESQIYFWLQPVKLQFSIIGNKPHCLKSVQTRSFFWSVFSCIWTEYGPEKNPYLDTFHTVLPWSGWGSGVSFLSLFILYFLSLIPVLWETCYLNFKYPCRLRWRLWRFLVQSL